jgi:hypothetical protein
MRLKRNTLFPKRSVGKYFALNRNRNAPFGCFVVSDTNGEIHKEARLKEFTRSTAHDEILDKHILHYQLKPLTLTLRVLGSFPVEMSQSGQ